MPSHRGAFRALLLLPPIPSHPAYTTLKAAYGPPLRAVFQRLLQSNPRKPARIILDIALPCADLHQRLDEPRSLLYHRTQNLVAGMYKLLCVTAATNDFATRDAENVDARVILVAYASNDGAPIPHQVAVSAGELQGPAVELSALAASPRQWDVVYSTEQEETEKMLLHFFTVSPRQREVLKVEGGILPVVQSIDHETPAQNVEMRSKHWSVAVGGTFDHLHIGHKLLLTMFAFVLNRSTSRDDQGERVLTIGITGDALLKNKAFAEHLESWQARQKAVHDFLSAILIFGPLDDAEIHRTEVNNAGPNGRAIHIAYPIGVTVRYVEISDPFGPTVTDEAISALVLSLETKKGGDAVNTKRQGQGWPPLEVFEVAVLDASEEETIDESFRNKLSSTEIRRMHHERTRANV